ncbi:hypothetical protein OG604_14450 [Streptomyces sp. NBC_01231]|nr:hypothetical protein OG604_14450 [Streptomyces sp. NBC_01231]
MVDPAPCACCGPTPPLDLPPQLRLIVEQNRLSLADELARGCQSLLMEADLAHTYRLAGRARLSAIEALLARNEGDYLPDRTSQWVEERRRTLSRQAADALSSAADLALRLHQYGDAVRRTSTGDCAVASSVKAVLHGTFRRSSGHRDRGRCP